MARRRSCRVAGESDATPLSAPAQWRAAVRRLVAILPAPASYGFGSKDGGRDGWRPPQAESALEELPAENNDAPRQRALRRHKPAHGFLDTIECIGRT